MIIDSLTHITPDGTWFNTNHDATLDRLIDTQQKAGVDKSILVGMPNLDDDDFVLSVTSDNPDKFIPVSGISLNGLSAEEIKSKISTLKTKGFAGIKIHPRFSGVSLLSNEVNYALDYADKYNMKVMVCTIHRPPSKPLGRPVYDVIHELCDNHKNTKMILLHGGYYDLLATSEIVRPYENVLLDLSLTAVRFAETSLLSDMRFLFKTFDRRICIGSDFPEYTFNQAKAIVEANLFDEEKLKNIFGQNLNRFFACE